MDVKYIWKNRLRCCVYNYKTLLNDTCCKVDDRTEHVNHGYEHQWPQKMLGLKSKHYDQKEIQMQMCAHMPKRGEVKKMKGHRDTKKYS